jgi:DCN1-like protein 1/2
VKRLEEVFTKYKEEDDDQIGPAGMEKFCQDLEVDPEDVQALSNSFLAIMSRSNLPFLQVVTLVIAYHMKAQQMGCFTREEFMKGFETLGYGIFLDML